MLARGRESRRVVVTTMPLLRAKELTDVIGAAQITHAICDLRLRDELDARAAGVSDAAHGRVLAR